MEELPPCFVNTYIFLAYFILEIFYYFLIIVLINPNIRNYPNIGMFLSCGLSLLTWAYFLKDYVLFTKCKT